MAVMLSAASAVAQGTTPPAAGAEAQLPPALGGAPINAGQIQRWFDAYTVLQAQDALKLSEAQYGPFVTRLKALQDIRRRHQQTHNQMLAELRRLTGPQSAGAEESVIADRLKALREENDRAAADLRKGYDAVDESLDIRQQARFRLFEERMEQQKLELLMQARQNARKPARGGSR